MQGNALIDGNLCLILGLYNCSSGLAYHNIPEVFNMSMIWNYMHVGICHYYYWLFEVVIPQSSFRPQSTFFGHIAICFAAFEL